MNVTFIKEYIGPNSGWSLYKPGDRATFPDSRALALIANDVAREGWGADVLEEAVLVDEPPIKNYSLLDLDELRQLAKEAGIKNYWSKGRERLEAELNDAAG